MVARTKETKPCSLCSEKIANSAVKCKHCDGYQGGWLFLNLGLPTLSLLVALVSLISLSAPVIKAVVTPENSRIKVVFQNFEDGSAYFVASNSGNRPGSIGEAYLDYGTRAKPERYYLKTNPKEKFIPPGTSRQLTFDIQCYGNNYPQIHYAQDGGFGSKPLASDVRLNVEVTEFDGTQNTQTTKLSELSGIMAINDRHSECLQSKLGEVIDKLGQGNPKSR